jgi:hypothetical protein
MLNSIQEILLHDWDPISIGDNHLLADEYNMYVFDIYRIFLAGSANHEVLYDYLTRQENDTIGASVEKMQRMKAVDKLIQLFKDNNTQKIKNGGL